ncbi:hypothetical protein [Pontibacter pamirensis]|nr:hypothetical protein [Pontibacter pamirensis]
MAGVQIVGIQNTSSKALDGGQVAAIHNYTSGTMQQYSSVDVGV